MPVFFFFFCVVNWASFAFPRLHYIKAISVFPKLTKTILPLETAILTFMYFHYMDFNTFIFLA